MRNLIFIMHTSLDGFVSGPNGEMNWIRLDDAMFDFIATMTDKADTALYGRITYEMMESYWPKAGEQPNATKHDKEHSAWYNNVSKIVLSKTLNETGLVNTKVIGDRLTDRIKEIKNQQGENILVFGSRAALHSLLGLGLIDEFWLFVNPILLGHGKPLFKGTNETIKLKLADSKTFTSGVLALHYCKL